MKKLVAVCTVVSMLALSSSVAAQNGRASRSGERSGVTTAWIAAGVGVAAAVAVLLLLPDGDNGSHAH